MFRLSFLKPSSGCNSRIFEYKIDTALSTKFYFDISESYNLKMALKKGKSKHVTEITF